MSKVPNGVTHGQATVRKYGVYGLMCGLTLGLLAGVLISGPYFHEWPLLRITLVTAACAIGGAAIGFFAGALAVGSEAAGGGGINIADGGHDSDGGAGGSGGDGGGSS
jgi:hypothetical protein